MIRARFTGRRGALLRTLAFLLSNSLVFVATGSAASLQGVVNDPDGRPVPGARVIVTGAQPGVREIDTDASGRFEVADLADGSYEVRVVLDGFTAAPTTVALAGDARAEIAVGLRVSAIAESLVVSAAHADLPLSQSASTVTVISGSELASRQIRAVGDALAYVPGLAVARTGGINSLTSLFTRGGESDFTLVLLDGMRLNAFGGGIDLSQVPLVDVERIEVVRGPQSAVFGSDAIGGVIQIVSRRGQRERLDALVEGGSFGTVRAQAGASGARRAWSWHVRGERTSSDGFTGIAPATGEIVGNDDGTASHVGFGGGWRAASGAEVRGTTQLSFTGRGFPGAYGSNPIGVYTEVDRVSRGENDRAQVGAEWLQPWKGAGSRVRQRTNVTVADVDSMFVSRFGTSNSESHRVSVRSQTDAALSSAFGVSGGVEVQRERAGSTFITGTAREQVPVRRWLAGYFAEARVRPASRLSLAAGLRVEQIHRDALGGDPFAFQARPAFNTDSVVSTNPKVSVAYLAAGDGDGDTTRLRFSAGTGIRPPDAFEIAFTDNPGLKPERSRSVDAGVQQTLGRGAAVLEATYFDNKYDDLIVTVGTSFRNASRYRSDNISNARARGLELAFGLRPLDAVDVRASYTLVDTEIRSVDRAEGEAPSPYAVGDQLIRRPRHQGSVTASYGGSRVSVFVEMLIRGEVRDVEPTFGAFGGVFTAEGYEIIDTGVSVRLHRLIQALLRVENLGGQEYEEAFGFPGPGRTAIVGVRFAAGR